MINPYEQKREPDNIRVLCSLKMTSNIDESLISGEKVDNLDEEYRLTAVWWSDLYCSPRKFNV